MADLSSFLVSIVINITIFLICLHVFGFVRRKFPVVYQPRLDLMKRKTKNGPPECSSGFYGWILSVYRVDQEAVYKTAGLDAVMFMRFFVICVKLFFVSALPGMLILFPINGTGGMIDVNSIATNSSEIGQFEVISMANIHPGSDRFWAHLVLSWLFYLYVFYLLEQNFVVYMHYRHRHMREQQLRGRALSVLVRNVPERLCSDEELFDFYRKLYPNHVVSASVAKDCSELNKMIAERQSYYDSLDHNYVAWQNAITKAEKNGTQLTNEQKQELRPRHRLPKDLATGKLETVDSMDYYKQQVENLNNKIEHAQQENYPVLNSGFITFNSSYIVNTLSLVQTTIVPAELECSQAPHPKDVYWQGFYFGRRSRWIRGYVIMIGVYVMVFWWSVPTAFVGTLADIKTLAAGRPWLAWVLDIPSIILSFIEGYVPAILLLVLMIMLPTILLKISQQEGIAANTWLDLAVFKKYYIFQVFNFFLIVTITGTLTDALNSLIESPTSIVSLLGKALPKTATFFATFILFSGLGGFPVQMLQIGNLIMSTIYKKYLCITEKEIRAAEAPACASYCAEYGKHLLIFVIGTTYATISPIVLPFCCIYFTLGYMVNKYKALYMYVPANEGGGRHWPLVFGRMLVGCVIGQITLIGYFGIKEAPIHAVLMIPLPILTILYYNENMSAFGVKCEYLPVCESVLVDTQRHSFMNPSKIRKLSESSNGSEINLPAFHDNKKMKEHTLEKIYGKATHVLNKTTHVPVLGTAFKGVGGLLSTGLKVTDKLKNQLHQHITTTDIDLEEMQRQREMGITPDGEEEMPEDQGYTDSDSSGDEAHAGEIFTVENARSFSDDFTSDIGSQSEFPDEDSKTSGLHQRRPNSCSHRHKAHRHIKGMEQWANLEDPYLQSAFRVKRLNTDMDAVYAKKRKRAAKKQLALEKKQSSEAHIAPDTAAPSVDSPTSHPGAGPGPGPAAAPPVTSSSPQDTLITMANEDRRSSIDQLMATPDEPHHHHHHHHHHHQHHHPHQTQPSSTSPIQPPRVHMTQSPPTSQPTSQLPSPTHSPRNPILSQQQSSSEIQISMDSSQPQHPTSDTSLEYHPPTYQQPPPHRPHPHPSLRSPTRPAQRGVHSSSPPNAHLHRHITRHTPSSSPLSQSPSQGTESIAVEHTSMPVTRTVYQRVPVPTNPNRMVHGDSSNPNPMDVQTMFATSQRVPQPQHVAWHDD